MRAPDARRPPAEIRRFRNVQLGPKAEMDKGQARANLRDMIARETSSIRPAPVDVTLRWFYEKRFLPQKEQQWQRTRPQVFKERSHENPCLFELDPRRSRRTGIHSQEPRREVGGPALR
jgi:hypothetical protein